MARDVRKIIRSASARMSGRQRGPDWSPDPAWRTPHAESYDVDDDRAKNSRPLGDGTVLQKRIYHEAIVETARDRVRRDRERDSQLERTMLDNEHHSTRTWAAGELQKHRAQALRRTDVIVLDALLSFMGNYRTGATFPSIVRIADRALLRVRAVIYSLNRLKAAGLLSWVRRTVMTGSKGEPGPQRQQTSNSYAFAPDTSPDARIRGRYRELLIAKLKRLGQPAPAVDTPPKRAPRQVSGELAATLARMEEGILARDALSGRASA